MGYKIELVEDAFAEPEFIRFKNEFHKYKTGYKIGNIRVFNPHLAYILDLDVDSGKLTHVKKQSGESENDYEASELLMYKYKMLDLFELGYEEGSHFFRNAYLKTDIDALPNPEVFVKRISRLYFEDGVEDDGKRKGWNFVKTEYPEILGKDNLKLYGYYSGICNEYERLVNEFKELFEIVDLNAEKPKNIIDQRFESHFDLFFKGAFSNKRINDFDFNILRDNLLHYFNNENKEFPKVNFSKPNKKAICYALGQLHKGMEGEPPTPDFINFCMSSIKAIEGMDTPTFLKYSQEKTPF